VNIAAHRPAACRFCGGALSALDRHRGWCGATACRFKAGRERSLQRRDAEIARRRRRAGVPAEVPVLWIEAHGTKLVPLPAHLRESYARHLAALAAAPLPETPPPPPPVEGTSELGRTCAFCRGRCCRYGAGRQAFVTGALLRRWLEAHPGATPAEAAADYLRRLPARHVEHSCLHHGAQGCTLPAGMRSDICNQYLCAPVAQALPVHETVVAMEGGARGVQRAAWIADDTRTLPSR
jgi:hypothetical protein